MNEIKANAATWEDIKRLSKENERLKRMLERKENRMRLWRDMAHSWHNSISKINNEIGDLKDE